jgi:hypothetical protein
MRHDYTIGECGWGHSIGMQTGGTTQGDAGTWIGHGPRSGVRMCTGDQIAVTMGSGRVGLFRIESVEYYSDPRDMWRAVARWLAYADEATASEAPSAAAQPAASDARSPSADDE